MAARTKLRPTMLSKHEAQLAQCAGKKRFPNGTLAHRALKGRRKIKGREAYRCEFCGGWHLGVSSTAP